MEEGAGPAHRDTPVTGHRGQDRTGCCTDGVGAGSQRVLGTHRAPELQVEQAERPPGDGRFWTPSAQPPGQDAGPNRSAGPRAAWGIATSSMRRHPPGPPIVTHCHLPILLPSSLPSPKHCWVQDGVRLWKALLGEQWVGGTVPEEAPGAHREDLCGEQTSDIWR